MKGLGNMAKMLRQAQAMQTKMQEELRKTEVEGSSGGGMVVVRANGHGEVLSVRIEPEVVDPEDLEMLEDLIAAACNDAQAKAKQVMSEKLGEVTGGLGLDLPSMMGGGSAGGGGPVVGGS